MVLRFSAVSFWVFGYGSLTWRPAFSHRRAVNAELRGYARRFFQGSTDHRGIPGAPGRVVTLVEEADAITLGRAYEVDEDATHEVLRMLDHREQGGYERRDVEVLLASNELVRALVYFAGPSNQDYLGPATVEAIAAQCARAIGPSGRNDEYVFELERFLRSTGADDAHVFAIAAALREHMDR